MTKIELTPQERLDNYLSAVESLEKSGLKFNKGLVNNLINHLQLAKTDDEKHEILDRRNLPKYRYLTEEYIDKMLLTINQIKDAEKENNNSEENVVEDEVYVKTPKEEPEIILKHKWELIFPPMFNLPSFNAKRVSKVQYFPVDNMWTPIDIVLHNFVEPSTKKLILNAVKECKETPLTFELRTLNNNNDVIDTTYIIGHIYLVEFSDFDYEKNETSEIKLSIMVNNVINN